MRSLRFIFVCGWLWMGCFRKLLIPRQHHLVRLQPHPGSVPPLNFTADLYHLSWFRAKSGRHITYSTRLLEDVSTRLGALSVLRAGGAGDSDPTYDLAIQQKREAALNWNRPLQTEDAQILAACSKSILKRLRGPLEQSRRTSLVDGDIGAAQLCVVHFFVINQIA